MANEINNEEDGFGNTTSIDEAFEGFKIMKLRSPDGREDRTELVVRLLGAMKSYKNAGKWAFFYGTHFGYCGENPRDPSKPRIRTFGCIQKKNNQTKEILVRCPKCDQISRAKLKEQSIQDKIRQANPAASEDELKLLYKDSQALKQIGDWLYKNSNSKKFWVNVMTDAGVFGPLQLSYKTHEKLKAKLREWSEKKHIDAFHPDKGVWIKFTRTGRGIATNDEVSLHTETVVINGEAMEKTKLAPLTKEQQAQALRVCPDLAKDIVKMLTAEQIQKLVDCTGEPSVVDEIFDGPKKAKEASAAPVDDTDYGVDPTEEMPEWAAAATQTPAPVKETPAPVAVVAEPVVEDDEEAKLLAQMKALKERKAKAAQAQPTPPTPSTSPEDDFLSKFQPR